MRKYSEPEIQIRKYEILPSQVISTSESEGNSGNDANNDDEFDIFGNN
ncbi:MAG: hypothetical protein IJS03_02875 [Eubacterium sp.]|nr:hypothetical protein [Eubacterium sp.]